MKSKNDAKLTSFFDRAYFLTISCAPRCHSNTNTTCFVEIANICKAHGGLINLAINLSLGTLLWVDQKPLQCLQT